MRGTRGAGATWAARCLAGGVAEADLAQLVGSPPDALSRGVHPLKFLELVCPQLPAAAPGRSPRRCCCGNGRTTAAALYGAHKATGQAQRAREILRVGKTELAMVQAALTPRPQAPAQTGEHPPIPAGLDPEAAGTTTTA